jgi:beta-lactamase class A
MRYSAAFLTVGSIIIFGAGIAAGAALTSEGRFFEHVLPITHSKDSHQTANADIRLTNPLLECAELPESVSENTLPRLEEDVAAIIDARQKSGDLKFASVYFRDLTNGPWFGVNESEVFIPASLLKVPLAMSFYAREEDEPGVLSKKIIYTPDPTVLSQAGPYAPEVSLEAGKAYTIRELIGMMLMQSSNEAAVALSKEAGIDQITSVYRDFGLTLPALGSDYKIDTHTYSSFFRILYNATYIDREDDEEILGLLAKTQFTVGLVAGVPAGTTVSHKYGAREIDGAGGLEQLHDCGIVYAPGKPYVLCVMTQGSDFTKLADTIKQISAAVYKGVSEQ